MFAAVHDSRAVVTIAAPSDADHVISSFRAHMPTIEDQGEAEVELAGRRFTIRRQFLDDVRGQDLQTKVRQLRRPVLILHAPPTRPSGSRPPP